MPKKQGKPDVAKIQAKIAEAKAAAEKAAAEKSGAVAVAEKQLEQITDGIPRGRVGRRKEAGERGRSPLRTLSYEREPIDADDIIFKKAARDGDTETVRKMLSTAGAKSLINYQDWDGHTPLYVAAQGGHETVTKQLIAACGNVDLQTDFGRTPLYAAAQNGHASVTEQLIEARCNVDLQAKDGSTALYIAAQEGHASSRSS